eukprot:1811342-Alexandrium_andersonii.AAC.1
MVRVTSGGWHYPRDHRGGDSECTEYSSIVGCEIAPPLLCRGTSRAAAATAAERGHVGNLCPTFTTSVPGDVRR